MKKQSSIYPPIHVFKHFNGPGTRSQIMLMKFSNYNSEIISGREKDIE